MKGLFFMFLVGYSILFSQAYAQGCSDAGFCSAGAMQAGVKGSDTAGGRNSVGISCTMGNGENGVAIVVPQAELTYYLSSQTYIEGKLPVNIASGNLGAHTGIGDPIVTCSHIISRRANLAVVGSLGARVGIGTADAADKGTALPMPYQNSLGTTDAIIGLGVNYGKYFSASVGYQQPLVQYNDNRYQPANTYPANPNEQDYFASKELRRKGDVLIRADGHVQWHKLLISAGPLFIYHLGEDTYISATGSRGNLIGSSGATLNVAASIAYPTKGGRFEVLAARPVIVREYRPDGLTRSIVLTVRYTKFW